jgi:hypothetical protein
LYALALSIITVLAFGCIPGGLGTISGSMLGLGISALNSVAALCNYYNKQ